MSGCDNASSLQGHCLSHLMSYHKQVCSIFHAYYLTVTCLLLLSLLSFVLYYIFNYLVHATSYLWSDRIQEGLSNTCIKHSKVWLITLEISNYLCCRQKSTLQIMWQLVHYRTAADYNKNKQDEMIDKQLLTSYSYITRPSHVTTNDPTISTLVKQEITYFQ